MGKSSAEVVQRALSWLGPQIAARAGLALGTIYSLLAWLAAAGWITCCTEDQEACHDRRPIGTAAGRIRKPSCINPSGALLPPTMSCTNYEMCGPYFCRGR
jgi:hypothetical protein